MYYSVKKDLQLLSFMDRFLARFRRKITVERADEEHDVTYVRIDEGEGSFQEIYLSNNETKRFCFALHCAVEDKFKEIQLTLTREYGPDEGRVRQIYTFKVPDWAKRSLDSKLVQHCFDVIGWDGTYPNDPPSTGPFR